MENKKITLALIVGNRGFFPGHLAEIGRAEMLQVLQQSGVDVVVLDEKESNHGAIESYEEAHALRRASSAPIPTALTASSSPSPISATSAPSPILSASPA